MCGSSQDGEAANAGRLADRLVREGGLTWEDVIAPAQPPPPAEIGPCDLLRDWRLQWRSVARACLSSGFATDRDRQFLATISGYEQQPTAKQLEWLRDIAMRVFAEVVRR
jgi:hypothetical protein